jgi:hypothetical protein
MTGIKNESIFLVSVIIIDWHHKKLNIIINHFSTGAKEGRPTRGRAHETLTKMPQRKESS